MDNVFIHLYCLHPLATSMVYDTVKKHFPTRGCLFTACWEHDCLHSHFILHPLCFFL